MQNLYIWINSQNIGFKLILNQRLNNEYDQVRLSMYETPKLPKYYKMTEKSILRNFVDKTIDKSF